MKFPQSEKYNVAQYMTNITSVVNLFIGTKLIYNK